MASENHTTFSATPSSSAAIAMNAFCTEIEAYFANRWHLTLLHVHLVLLTAIIVAIVVLIWQCSRQTMLVHRNLLFLFANIILLYLFHAVAWFSFSLRYRILLSSYHDPCELLTPAWMVPLFHAPYFAYTVAFPAFHFAIMLERIRATVLADKYEHEGSKVTLWLVLGIWSIALGYMSYVIRSAFEDTDLLGHAQGIVFLTSSKYNALPILYVTVAALLLVIGTAFCDWRIFVLNRRIRAMRSGRFDNATDRTKAVSYNLSLSYQLNENALAMRLILPLDISYALVYPVFIGLIIVVRAYRTEMPAAEYNFFVHFANTLLFLHSFVTLLVYIRFVKFMRLNQSRAIEQAKTTAANANRIYFRQLESQWNGN